jgi:hypothetical protein
MPGADDRVSVDAFEYSGRSPGVGAGCTNRVSALAPSSLRGTYASSHFQVLAPALVDAGMIAAAGPFSPKALELPVDLEFLQCLDTQRRKGSGTNAA